MSRRHLKSNEKFLRAVRFRMLLEAIGHVSDDVRISASGRISPSC